MSGLVNVSRRDVLRGLVGASGLVLGVNFLTACATAAGTTDAAAPAPEPDRPTEPAVSHEYDVFLAIDTHGGVTIVAHRSEMGTGIRTALPMVLADELGADWERVRIEQALGDARYGDQNTDGSKSMRDFVTRMREVGAAARLMLERAAAARWGVPEGECRAAEHTVVHGPSGRALGFGELAGAAATLPVPADDELTFRPRSEWRYVGKGVPITDLNGIVTGKAEFGLDVVREGMKYATIERCPVLGGRAASFDDRAALAVPGVEQVVEIPAYRGAPAFNALGGVAVIASNTWAALAGRRALQIEWDTSSEHADYDSDVYREDLLRQVRRPGRIVRERGDVDLGFDEAEMIVEAEYTCPHLAHAPMEPPCAVAEVTEDGCEVWAPTQNPQAAQSMVARALRLSPSKVDVHVTLLGGGFGRKSKPDYIVEAALLSKELAAPVQVVWTREDDIRHDYFHSVAALRFKAGLDGRGTPTAWLQSSAFPSISSTFNPAVRSGSAGELGLGFTDLPYDVPNLRIENGEAQAHVRIGWLRAVANVYHAFGVCSFADELAHAAGKDPVTSLLDLLGAPRQVDPRRDGAEYGNYGQSIERYPLDVGRLRAVVELVAQRAGWGRTLPQGHGLGIAVHRSFLTYVANVVEVAVAEDGRITIPRVDVVADCGLAVHPDRVAAQFEGSVIFGLSLALNGSITAKEGRIVEGNFDSYPVLRSHQAPQRMSVHIVENDELPAGAGEPGVPPVAPAVCNAIFAATGQRIRRLPVIADGSFRI